MISISGKIEKAKLGILVTETFDIAKFTVEIGARFNNTFSRRCVAKHIAFLFVLSKLYFPVML